MKKSFYSFQTLFLAASISLAATNTAAGERPVSNYEFAADFNGKKVPVDCDLLNQGRLTAEFAAHLDPLGHYSDPNRLRKDAQVFLIRNNRLPTPKELTDEVISHIADHGVTREKVKNVAEYCNQQYL